MLRALRVAARLCVEHVVPARKNGRSFAKQSGGLVPPKIKLRHRPLTEGVTLNRNIFDHDSTGSVAKCDSSTDEFRKNSNLASALLKSTHVEDSRGQNLSGANARDTVDSLEDTAATGDFDNEADDDGCVLLPIRHDHIAHATDSVAERVKDRTPREPSNIHTRRRHGYSVPAG